MKRLYAICLLVLFIFVSAFSAVNGNEGVSPADEELRKKIIEATTVFVEIQYYIQRYYYRGVEVKECLDKVLAGGLAKCLDPHSYYISPSEAALFTSKTKGKFFGIGIEMTQDKDGRIIVVSPIEGTPAWHAGLVAGDIITHIGKDGNDLLSTKGMTLMEIANHIRGSKGTPVTLKILRGKEEKIFTIVRDEIVIASVSKRDLGGRLGYVRIRQFQENTVDDFRRALEELKAEGSCGAVLDFRDNPGGLLNVVLEMVSLWSKKAGDVLIVEKFRSHERELVVTEPAGDFRNFPIVILVDKGSASASEIFAGILQDWGHPVVGVKTYGKGSVQILIDLSNGGILALTIAEYLVGNAKKPVDGIGIIPNYVVENPRQTLPEDPIERNKFLNRVDPASDPQLKKAVEVLNGLTVSCQR